MDQYNTHLQISYRYIKSKPTSYVPTEDGFVSSSGNPTLAAKYGNTMATNPACIPNPSIQYSINLPIEYKQSKIEVLSTLYQCVVPK
jgi:hypothetical protein